MKTTKTGNFLDFLTTIKPFVNLFRTEMTDF